MAQVVIFDTVAPLPNEVAEDIVEDVETSVESDVEYYVELAESLGDAYGYKPSLTVELLEPLDAETQLLRFKEELERFQLFPKNTPMQQFRGLMDVFKTNAQMTYQPSQVMPVPITLICAEEGGDSQDSDNQDSDNQNSDDSHAQQRQDPTWGWSRYAKGSVDVILSPGTHMSMIVEPHVEALSATLQSLLEGK
ncbi:MAG: hypothetical protein AAF702_38600 [Chloroflexota bacterium]